jgi:hypothetical protein
MKYLLSKHWTMLLLILLPLSVSLACNILTGGGAEVTPTAVILSVPREQAFGPGTFMLADTKSGLADLSSYKATLTYSFDGTQAGQAEQWSKTYIMLATKEPAARQLTVETRGAIPAVDSVFMAEADGASYERLGQNDCNANVIDQGISLAGWMEPAGFLTSVMGADEAGKETVNDVAANHYTFDERALGALDIMKSTGEMWVASDGGYIVKYKVTTKGDAKYFGEGIEGTVTWDYELTDVNKPLTLELPADCPAGMVDAPLLPDASNVIKLPSIIMYDTASSPADAAAFYQEQIPTLGWKITEKPTIGDTTAILIFSQEKQTLTITIHVGDTDTKVEILLENSQK